MWWTLQHNVHVFFNVLGSISRLIFQQNFFSSNWKNKLLNSLRLFQQISNELPMRILWPFIVKFREQETVHTSSNLNPGQPRVMLLKKPNSIAWLWRYCWKMEMAMEQWSASGGSHFQIFIIASIWSVPFHLKFSCFTCWMLPNSINAWFCGNEICKNRFELVSSILHHSERFDYQFLSFNFLFNFGLGNFWFHGLMKKFGLWICTVPPSSSPSRFLLLSILFYFIFLPNLLLISTLAPPLFLSSNFLPHYHFQPIRI